MGIANLNKITNEWNLNAKHPLWYSHYKNPGGNILYNRTRTSDYAIIGPDTPAYYSEILGNKPTIKNNSCINLKNFKSLMDQNTSNPNPNLIITQNID